MSEQTPTTPTATGSTAVRLSAATADGKARAQALDTTAASGRVATSLVTYRSQGSLLIIGREERAFGLAKDLKSQLKCAVLVTASNGKVVKLGGAKTADRRGKRATASVSPLDVPFVRGKLEGLTGHLGEFDAVLATPNGGLNLARHLGLGRDHFDLVLDLTTPPWLRRELPPPGYYAPGEDKVALQRALAELPDLIGEFEKPRYFNYDAAICAHSRSGLKGCTRCIDACPTLAIHSIGDQIEVDPYLCQGAGSCATACPTGAITYAYPVVADLLSGLKALLKAYRDAGGKQPSLLFYGADSGQQLLGSVASALPENVLPVEVEEVGAVGLDTWLAALAYGSHNVVLLLPPTVPALVRRELTAQLTFARTILEGMGYAGERLQLVEASTEDEALAALRALAPQPETCPAGFAAVNEKRTTVRLAVDHLYAQAKARPPFVDLPAGAPFGEIRVDREGCTLCMACAGICPHSALSAGGDLPQLLFVEWNCVQCGLCETACPERVITLAPRFVYDAEVRRTTRTLNEEQPFCCIVCGKPFATQKMLSRMQEKLKGHWMFQEPEAMRRMQMCEDCRVKDMLVHEGLIDVHKKPS